MTKLRHFCLLCLLMVGTACAQPERLSPRKVVQDIAAGDVVLTRELHQAFWSAIREGRSIPDHELREQLGGALELNLRFQQALFESAIASLKAQRVMRTEEFLAIDATYASRAASALNALVQPEHRAASMQSLSAAVARMRNDARTLLEAAANGSAFSLSSGLTATADEATLTRLKSGIESTRSRVERLLSPAWHE